MTKVAQADLPSIIVKEGSIKSSFMGNFIFLAKKNRFERSKVIAIPLNHKILYT